MITNKRYLAYLRTTSKPTNWKFMEFIWDMKSRYTGGSSIFGRSIEDHDDFDDFIEKEVENEM